MNCPNCDNRSLVAVFLEANLIASRCPQCEGHWIPAFQYWRWLHETSSRGTTPAPESPVAVELSPPGPEKAHLCPECQRLLIKHKVGKGLSFSIDRCSFCGGFWFDRAEWETLRQRGLHQAIHLVFAAPWQREIREERSLEALRSAFEERLGTRPYGIVRDFKVWLSAHPARSDILAYLSDPTL